MNEERTDKRSLSGRVFERRRMGKERGERERKIYSQIRVRLDTAEN